MADKKNRESRQAKPSDGTTNSGRVWLCESNKDPRCKGSDINIVKPIMARLRDNDDASMLTKSGIVMSTSRRAIANMTHEDLGWPNNCGSNSKSMCRRSEADTINLNCTKLLGSILTSRWKKSSIDRKKSKPTQDKPRDDIRESVLAKKRNGDDASKCKESIATNNELVYVETFSGGTDSE